jgi:hypothetical protein
LSFEEAAEIFRYDYYEAVDFRSDYGGTRYIAVGCNNQMIILTVVYTERKGRIRIISARRATKTERRLYHEYCS